MSTRLNWRILLAGLVIAAVAFTATALTTRSSASNTPGELPAPTSVAEPKNIPTIPLLPPADPLPEPEAN